MDEDKMMSFVNVSHVNLLNRDSMGLKVCSVVLPGFLKCNLYGAISHNVNELSSSSISWVWS